MLVFTLVPRKLLAGQVCVPGSAGVLVRDALSSSMKAMLDGVEGDHW